MDPRRTRTARKRKEENYPKISPFSFILILLAAGLLLRIVYLILYRLNDPLYDLPLSDAAVYDRMALEFAGLEKGNRWSGPFYQAPLFPLLLGLLYSAAGRSFFLVYAAHGLLGLITLCLIFSIGRRLFEWRVGLLAALLALFHGTLIFFENKLLPTTLGVFLTTLSAWVLLQAGDSPILWLAGGASLGLLGIARPNMLLAAPLVLLWCLASLWKKKERLGLHPLLAAALLVLGTAIPIAPVTVRNVLESKEFIPIASEWGLNFFVGNNPESKGTNSTPPSLNIGAIENQSEESHRIAEEALGRSLRTSEVSKYWAYRSLEFLRKNPLLFFENLFKKALLYLGNFEAGATFIPNAEFRYVPLLYVLRVPFGFIFAFGIFGILLSLRREGIWLLFAFLAANAASLIAFFVISRLRLAVVPILAVGAAYALIFLFRELSGSRTFRVLALSVLPCAGFLLLYSAWGPVLSASLAVPLLILSGFFTLLFVLGRKALLIPAAASSSVLFVLSLTNPVDGLSSSMGMLTKSHTANALNGIGEMQKRNNRGAEAEETFLRVLEMVPTFSKSIYNLFEMSVASRKTDAAERYLDQLKHADPDYPVPLPIMGLYALNRGDLDAAEDCLKDALEKNPREFDGAFYLGYLYKMKGRFKEARELFQQALRDMPQDHPKRNTVLECLWDVQGKDSE